MNVDIDDITLRVYAARMDEDSGEGAFDRMLAQDNDDGKKMKRRAQFYRPVVTEVLVQLGLHVRYVPTPPHHVSG